MIGRDDFELAMRESELDGHDAFDKLRRLGLSVEDLQVEARMMLSETEGVDSNIAICAAFTAGVELGVRVARNEGRP